MNTTLRNLWVGLKAILVLTLVVGVLHTFVMTGLGQLVFPRQGQRLDAGIGRTSRRFLTHRAEFHR